MGADLLLTVLVQDQFTKLDWPAGRKSIREMDGETLMRVMEEISGDYWESLTEARREANDIISRLKDELKNEDARDAYAWALRGAILHIRGGTSWGEDPSEGWTAFVDAQRFPDALRAIGFEVD